MPELHPALWVPLVVPDQCLDGRSGPLRQPGNRRRAETGGPRAPRPAPVGYDQWHPEMITSAERRRTGT